MNGHCTTPIAAAPTTRESIAPAMQCFRSNPLVHRRVLADDPRPSSPARMASWRARTRRSSLARARPTWHGPPDGPTRLQACRTPRRMAGAVVNPVDGFPADGGRHGRDSAQPVVWHLQAILHHRPHPVRRALQARAYGHRNRPCPLSLDSISRVRKSRRAAGASVGPCPTR